MALNYTYPVKGTPSSSDEILIIDSQSPSINATKKVSVASVLALGTGEDPGVQTFQATNSTFITYTPNTASTGSVTLTGALSATGTAGATTFLRGDNTWSTAITAVSASIGSPISVSTTSGVATVGFTGALAIANGGTALTSVGTSGQVLVSNGTALAYGTPTDTTKLPLAGGAMTGAVTGNQAVTAFRPYATIAGTSVTLTDAEIGKLLITSSSSTVTLTIPADASSTTFPLGTEMDFFQNGSGTVSVVGAAGVSINGVTAGVGVTITARYGGLSIKTIAANTWIAVGKI